MAILVLGASGATGRLLVEELLGRGERVTAMVRSPEKLPAALRSHEGLSVVRASVLDLDDGQIAGHVRGCAAVASCLGHTLSLRGIYGRPRRLVTEAVRRVCAAIAAARGPGPTKVVLMNTAGNRNRDLCEPLSLGERCVIGLVRLLLPPHVDNEEAADYLRGGVGQDHEAIQWAVVRPDTLTHGDRVTEYEVHPSPTRSAIFDPGSTSRINVAHFMADLITDEPTWNRWKGQMPVIYDAAAPPGGRGGAARLGGEGGVPRQRST